MQEVKQELTAIEDGKLILDSMLMRTGSNHWSDRRFVILLRRRLLLRCALLGIDLTKSWLHSALPHWVAVEMEPTRYDAVCGVMVTRLCVRGFGVLGLLRTFFFPFFFPLKNENCLICPHFKFENLFHSVRKIKWKCEISFAKYTNENLYVLLQWFWWFKHSCNIICDDLNYIIFH